MAYFRRRRAAAALPLVMTLQEVIDGTATVTLVVHEDDESAGWQYLVSGAWDDDRLRLAHRAHLIRDDPSLAALETLPLGRFAARDDGSSPWRYGNINDIPT